VDFDRLKAKFLVHLLEVQQFFGSKGLTVVPDLLSTVQTLVPCRYKVFYGKDCGKCSVCK
jgi:NADH:ubiquinone oxidoreductase subunit F (NADH-binding)